MWGCDLPGFQGVGLACDRVEGIGQRCGQGCSDERGGAICVVLGRCGWAGRAWVLPEAQNSAFASGTVGGFHQGWGPGSLMLYF